MWSLAHHGRGLCLAIMRRALVARDMPPSARSTRDDFYTAAQAEAGWKHAATAIFGCVPSSLTQRSVATAVACQTYTECSSRADLTEFCVYNGMTHVYPSEPDAPQTGYQDSNGIGSSWQATPAAVALWTGLELPSSPPPPPGLPFSPPAASMDDSAVLIGVIAGSAGGEMRERRAYPQVSTRIDAVVTTRCIGGAAQCPQPLHDGRTRGDSANASTRFASSNGKRLVVAGSIVRVRAARLTLHRVPGGKEENNKIKVVYKLY